jgi:hypothetical protein
MPQIQLERLWLKALLFALAGYALFGRGFAYLFVGEVILILGVLVFLPTLKFWLFFSDPVLLLWAIFAFWGFCRTVPFLSKYHFDALRDAVLWGYGVFALLIVAFVRTSDQISRILNTYRKFLFWYLPIVPFLVIVSTYFRNYLPALPWGNDITIIMLKAGDAAVHLTAAALFLLIFSDRRAGSKSSGMSVYRVVGFAGWSLAATVVLIVTRAGFLAMIVPIAVVSLWKFREIGWKVAALAVVGAMLALMMLSSELITVRVHHRNFTSDQALENLGSILGAGHENGTEGTKEWRLIWWGEIIRYTVFGPYRWTGKGFGINLAQEDGPPGISKEDTALRSPHNGSMTVLARMGIPGLAIWAALNLVFVLRLLRAHRVASRAGSRFWSGVNLWILCYWLAAFINMSFDVYLEGPQGGIWFWSIIGFGVAAMRIQSYEARRARLQMELDALGLSDTEHALAPA